ncbi:MAG: hypothetical protein RBT63_09960 [Bdellovibrionales bacterium]|jgi:hypothetical protein|nr:hypothetical protein [Bdellovibrionales bacterium]
MKPSHVEHEESPRLRFSRNEDRAVCEIEFTVSEPFKQGQGRQEQVLALGLTAVILEHGDDKPFYWALAHMGERPDFHIRKSFSYRLESPA